MDVAAGEADGGRQIVPAGGQPGDRAAPAIAGHRGRAGAGDEAERGRHVGECRVPGDLASNLTALRDVVLVVAELDARRHAVEHGRSDGEVAVLGKAVGDTRSEEHTSELQSLMRISYAVFCLKKKKNINIHTTT